MTLLPHALTKMPSQLRANLFIMFLLSPYVIVEPAPFDIFFIYTMLLTLVYRWFYFPKALAFPMVLMFLYVMISMPSMLFVTDYAGSSMYHAITVYLIVLSFFLASLVVTYKGMVELIIDGLIIGMVISVTIGLVFKYTGFHADIVGLMWPRFNAFFKDPNVFGPAACSTCVLLMNRLTYRSDQRIIGGLFLMVLAFSVLISYSRAAWGLFIMMFIIFCGPILLEQARAMRLVRLLIIGALGFVSVILLFIIAQKMGYLESIKNRLSLQSYDNTRFENHRLLLRVATTDPFGHGPKTATLIGAAHSSYIRIFYENGVFAFAFYQLFMLYCLWVAFRMTLVKWPYKTHALACLSVLAGFMLNGFTIDTFHWRHLYIFCGLILGMNLLFKQMLAEQRKRNRPAGSIPFPD